MALLPGLGEEDLSYLDRLHTQDTAQRAAASHPNAAQTALLASQLARTYPGISAGLAYAFASTGQGPNPTTTQAWQAELATRLGSTPGVPRKAKSTPQQEADRVLADFQSGGPGAALSGLPVVGGALAGAGKYVGDVARPVVRTAALGLQAGQEALGGVYRAYRGTTTGALQQQADAKLFGTPASEQSAYLGAGGSPTAHNPNWITPGNIVSQTTAGQALGQLISGQQVDVGGGYLPSLDSSAAKAQTDAARKYSPYLVGDHAWTPGRALAGAVFEPDDDAFNILSGLGDAVVAWKLDPGAKALQQLGEVNRARKLWVPDEAAAAGAIDGARKLTSPKTYSEWQATNKGQSVVGKLRETTDHLTIHEKTKIPYVLSDGTPIIDNLAKARTDAAVTDALKPYLLESGTAPTFSAKPGTPRIFQSMPGRTVFVGDGADMNEVIDQVNRSLVNAKAPIEERQRITRLLAQAGDSKTKKQAAVDAFGTVVKHQLIDSGASEEFAQKTSRLFPRELGNVADYGSDTVGRPITNPFVAVGDQTYPLPHPIFEDQFLNGFVTMPDARTVRRAVSGFAPFLSEQYALGKASTLAQGGVDAAMGVWKRLILTRPALGVRVVGEEQIRMAASGLDSAFRHPLSAIAWALGNPDETWVNRLDAMGARFTPSGRAAEEAAAIRRTGQGIGEDLVLGPSGRSLSELDQAAANRGRLVNKIREVKGKVAKGTGDYDLLSDDDPYMQAQYRRFSAVRDRQMHQREFATVFAHDEHYPQGIVEELARHRKLSTVQSIIGEPDLQAVKDSFWDGPLSRQRHYMAEDSALKILGTSREAADAHVDVMAQRLGVIHNNHPDLIEALKTGKLRGADLLDESGHASKAATSRVQEMLDEGADLPNRVRIERYRTLSQSDKQKAVAGLGKGMDWMFEQLATKPSNYLSRSTTYRQYHWQDMGRLFPYMDDASRAHALEAARLANLSDETVGNLTAIHQRLGAMGSQAPDSLLDFEHADTIAKHNALNSTKALLYDLSDKMNISDMLRNVTPFLEAWKEIISRWAKIVYENPQVIRRAGQLVEAAKQPGSSAINKAFGDTTETGGFFHKDSFGQEVFTYPGSQLLTKTTMGVPLPLTGNVQGLNLVGQGMPGFGPAVQVPVSYLLPDKPKWDWAAKIISPYGKPQGELGTQVIESFMPAWFKKVYTAAFKSPTSDRTYANTVFDAARYLASTGDYQLQGPTANDEMNRLLSDAKGKAKTAYMIRGIAQSTLPTGPQTDWLVHDKNGRLTLAWRVAKWYQDKVKETGSTTDAMGEFLNKFGLDNFMIPQAKSQAVITAPSHQDGLDWAREHPDAVNKFPTVYGLFAPDSGAYSATAYERQFQRGERQQLTPQEMTQLANNRLASYVYNNAKDAIGTKPNAQQTQQLRDMRTELMTEFPGYGTKPVDFTANAKLIVDLQRAAKDPTLAKTDAGQALVQYLQWRDTAIAKAAAAGVTLGAERAAPLRNALNKAAEGLLAAHPTFGPMFDSVFSREVTA